MLRERADDTNDRAREPMPARTVENESDFFNLLGAKSVREQLVDGIALFVVRSDARGSLAAFLRLESERLIGERLGSRKREGGGE
jgi:hypothetical protein